MCLLVHVCTRLWWRKYVCMVHAYTHMFLMVHLVVHVLHVCVYDTCIHTYVFGGACCAYVFVAFHVKTVLFI